MDAKFKLKVSAQDTNTVTLVNDPAASGDADGGMLADTIANAVITFDNARDSVFFPAVNTRYVLTISRV